MELRLEREASNSQCTPGVLYVDGLEACFTLEDVQRPLKVADHTAIPLGRYQVIITHSKRFNEPLPLLLNVPGFTGIRIHSGNTDADTSGCILVGATRPSPTLIGASRMALQALQPRIQAALDSGDELFIMIECVSDTDTNLAIGE